MSTTKLCYLTKSRNLKRVTNAKQYCHNLVLFNDFKYCVLRCYVYILLLVYLLFGCDLAIRMTAVLDTVYEKLKF